MFGKIKKVKCFGCKNKVDPAKAGRLVMNTADGEKHRYLCDECADLMELAKQAYIHS